jgi:hypothetical protein
MPEATKTWRLIQSLYEGHPDLLSNTKKTIHRAMGNLCLQAFHAREVALLKEGMNIPTPPEYINRLRRQRDEADAKRQERIAKTVGKGTGYTQNQTTAGSSNSQNIGGNDNNGGLQPSKAQAHSQGLSLQHTEHDGHEEGVVDNEAVSYINALDSNAMLGRLGVTLEMDPDLMYHQENNLGGDHDQPIDWAQWDAWLTNVDMNSA